jgi:hypothetical protein
MAPPEKEIIAAIHNAIELIYADPASRDNLTVRVVREAVEPKLGLERGFLTREEWKEKSKKIIKEYAVRKVTSCVLRLLTGFCFVAKID